MRASSEVENVGLPRREIARRSRFVVERYLRMTPGHAFRAALERERPLQIAGTLNAYSALLAQRAGFSAIYLSGSGVATHALGLPDLGLTSLDDVATEARRITERVKLPLLVDIDTGWGHAFTIARAIQVLAGAGVAAVHLEDQVTAKRCGHRPGKSLVSAAEMCDRIRAAVDAKPDPEFVVMARTDAAASEGIAGAVSRAKVYVAAGADMIFAEALTSLDDYRQFTAGVGAPVLANLTEFGRTPLFTVEELRAAGIAMALYPLSAARAADAAQLAVYAAIRQQGTQRSVVDRMQTRDELYDILGYYAYERKLDELSQCEEPPR